MMSIDIAMTPEPLMPSPESLTEADCVISSMYEILSKSVFFDLTTGKSKEEIEEEDQLQLALAISQSEAEAKEQEKKRRQTYMSLDATPPGGNPEPVVCV